MERQDLFRSATNKTDDVRQFAININIKDSSNFPINDLRSTSLIVKTLSAIWACSFLRAAFKLDSSDDIESAVTSIESVL